MPLLPFIVAGLLIASPVFAKDLTVGNLTVSQAWARATPSAAPVGGGYITIANRGSEPDSLLSVTSSAADRVEIHESATEGGVMRMRPVERLTIAPGQTITFKPGGLHLMLLKPKVPLRQGNRLTADFAFEKAGAITVEFDILGVGASGPAHGGH